ncbi:MAG: hypothetical protein HRT61_05495 [Ekhidna sp.]|nr:hypothetical protein [Ekhidna sp.]
MVPRLGISFSIDDNKGGLSSPDVTETVFQYMFTPGLEYHFLNEGGFTSYIALDIIVVSRFMERINSTGRDVTGALVDPDDSANPLNDPNVSIPLSDRGFFGLGGYLAFGADYHFSSRFYVGAEIGFQAMTAKTSDVEVNGNVFQEGFRFFDGSLTTTNSLRIGFRLF